MVKIYLYVTKFYNHNLINPPKIYKSLITLISYQVETYRNTCNEPNMGKMINPYDAQISLVINKCEVL